MTNDAEAVRAFAEHSPGGVVTKMMSPFAVHDEEGRELVVFTTPLEPEDLEDLEGLELCPMTFAPGDPRHHRPVRRRDGAGEEGLLPKGRVR